MTAKVKGNIHEIAIHQVTKKQTLWFSVTYCSYIDIMTFKLTTDIKNPDKNVREVKLKTYLNL